MKDLLLGALGVVLGLTVAQSGVSILATVFGLTLAALGVLLGVAALTVDRTRR